METSAKKIIEILKVPPRHWVGDGFPVRSLIMYNLHGKQVSPFLLLDYTGTVEFSPASHPRGVGQHPHRGFETVTIVYKGEVTHRDSTGKGGTIGPGDVQWMTAASGIVHEELHSEAFTRSGGEFDMAQLWVNLPAKDKMSAPGYQAILAADIPSVALADDGGIVRVIAGNYAGHAGPAHTFSPMDVWDIHLKAGAALDLPCVEGWTAAVVVLHGQVRLNGASDILENQVALLDGSGKGFTIETSDAAGVLFLSGESLNEQIAGYGPFVMNTDDEISKAIDDYNSGRFGRIEP